MTIPENLLALKAKADPIMIKYSVPNRDKVTTVTPLLDVISATELSEKIFPPMKWAVPEILPEGLTVLAGTPKVGKSWFCLDLAMGIASGNKVFKKIPVEKGRVLYLALEDGQERIQKRLKVLNSGVRPKIDELDILTKLPADVGIIEAIRDYLDRNIDTRLVIIDVYAQVKSPSKNYGNLYAEDYKEASRWKKLADSYNVGVLLVHHTRKQSADDFINSVSGTNGLTAAADTILRLERSRQSAQATLEITSRDAPEDKLALERDGANWVLLGDAEKFDVSSNKRIVFDLVEAKGSLTPKDLAEAKVGISYENARQLLSRMSQSGNLERQNGRYYLPGAKFFDFT